MPQSGPGEVLIEVGACAICGSDPKILARDWASHPSYGEFIFGHEYTGQIATQGEGITEFAVGDRVAVEPHKGCGVCDKRRDGYYTTCLNYSSQAKGHRHYGFSTNGGYAE
jgi:L-iditol 2-dehydrogenase